MDTIKFNILNKRDTNNPSIKTFDIELELNSQKMSNQLMNLGQVLAVANVGGLPFNAQFDLFTCDCGVPGCAGFHEFVEQRVSEFEVQWSFPTENYYKTEKFVYNFDKINFMQEFKRFHREVFELENLDFHYQTQLSNDSMYVGEEGKEKENEVVYQLSEDVKYQVKNFIAYDKFSLLMSEKFPEMLNTKYRWMYGDLVINHNLDYSFEECVCKLLNQFPSARNDSALFLSKSVVSGVALKELVAGNNTRFKRVLLRSYRRFGLTGYDFVYINEESGIDENNFDIDQLRLVKI